MRSLAFRGLRLPRLGAMRGGGPSLRTQIEGLRTNTTPNGRQTTVPLKVFGVDPLPAGVSRSGDVVTVSDAGAGLDNWDITGLRVDLAGTNNFVTDCYYGPVLTVVPSSMYPISIEPSSVNAVVRYNTIDGVDGPNGPTTFINTPITGNGASATGGQNWLVEHNRFLHPGGDVLKTAGNGVCQWNYFGPPANYPPGSTAWLIGTTYALGEYVLDADNQLFESLQAGNIGNTPPASRFDSNAFWQGKDPHGDGITTIASDGVGQTFRNNLFDWDSARVTNAVGVTQCVRVVRNTGTNFFMGPVDFSSNVVSAAFKGFYAIGAGYIRDWFSTTTYPLGGFAEVGGVFYESLIDSNLNNLPASSPADWAVTTNINAPGPVRFIDNWLPKGINNLYFANLIIDAWSNNRDEITDALITGPTLRATPTPFAPSFTSGPTVTGVATLGSTLTMAYTFTGSAPVTVLHRWRINGATVSGADGLAWVTAGIVPGDSLTAEVNLTNGSGTTGWVASNALPVPLPRNFVDTNATANIAITPGGSATCLTFSVWMSKKSSEVLSSPRIITASQGFEVYSGTSGVLTVLIWDSTGSARYSAQSPTGVIVPDTVQHVFISYDANTATPIVRVDGVLITMSVSTAPLTGNVRPNRVHGPLRVGVSVSAMTACDMWLEYGASVRDFTLFWNGGVAPDLTGVGSPQLWLGGNMMADERAGNTAQGWNDGFNLGSGTIIVTSGTFTDVP